MRRHYFSLGLCALLAWGCIRNDIPFPTIRAYIQDIAVAGMQQPAEILPSRQQVNLLLSDTVNLRAVSLQRLELSAEARLRTPLPALLDLRQPLYCTLQTYQDYVWRIEAQQPIARRLLLEGQVGEALIDIQERTAIAHVGKEQPLDAIRVLEMQLGASNAHTSPDPATVSDFRQPCTFTLTRFGEQEHWQVAVLHAEEQVTTGPAQPWARRALLQGEYATGSAHRPTFAYREQGTESWTLLPDEEVVLEGGRFHAWLKGLDPQTSYTYRAVLGEEYGKEKHFQTEEAPVLPNLSLDDWHLNRKTWNPWAEGGQAYWMTGNAGITIVSSSNTTPTDDAVSGKAARLETRNVAIAGLAAGNLFTGDFKTNISNPADSPKFGRPYMGRPQRLRGQYKYAPKTIDVQKNGTDKLGQMDQCHIYISLEDWGDATQRPADRVVVGYGEFKSAEAVDMYAPFDIEIAYQQTDRRPTHVVLVATSSIYGDQFTGGVGSLLHVDELELVFE